MKTWWSTTDWGATRWQRALTASVAALVMHAVPAADPAPGLDPSWETALALARAQGLRWGPEIVFTAGPLGYLHNPTYYYLGQAVLGAVYQLAVLTALILGIDAALRLRCAPTTSLAAAVAATGAANLLIASLYPDLAVLAAFAWASVPLLQREAAQSTVFTTCVALGAVAGFETLVKVNSGPTILLIALAVSALLDWRAVGRHLATVLAGAASGVTWWLLAGQRPADLPLWLRRSAEIGSGYVDAMAVPLPVGAVPTVLLTLAWLAAVAAGYVRGGPAIPRRFVLLVGLLSLVMTRTAFGRFDPGHVFILSAAVVVSIAITPGVTARQRALVLGVVTYVFLSLAGPYVFIRAEGAVASPVRAVNRLATLAIPGRWNAAAEQAKARQRARYGVPATFVQTIGSGTVHVAPTEASVVWAYGFAWHPTPVFQTYSAYTPTLDALNSDTLAQGPQYVLSQRSSGPPATGIDDRLATQQSPLYYRALLCNYTVTGVENNWALFTRGRPHCGPLTPVSESSVQGHDTVAVPAASGPNKVMLVSIELRQNVFDRLFQGSIIPLTTFTVALDGVDYRIVTANAAEPFLISAPASVRGTNLEIGAHRIGVGRHTSFGATGAAARLRFFEMTVD